MDSSTAFKPFEADYSASYGVYLSPVGKGKKAPVSVEKHGLFSINNPQSWVTLDAAETHRSKLEQLPEIAANFKPVIVRAMQPYEVCIDFDPETDEQHTEAATWAMSFKDARIERSVNGGYHVLFTYSYPGMFPAKIATPNGLKIDVKRGYYPASVDAHAGGSALTIGECVNDREAIADLTERDYKTLQALLFVCGKSDLKTATSSASGFKSGVIASPQEEDAHRGAQAQIERIKDERPNLYAVLQETPGDESTLPTFSGVTGHKKLGRIISDLWEVTHNSDDVLAVLCASPVGSHANRTERKQDRSEHAYKTYLAGMVRRVLVNKRNHDATNQDNLQGVKMSLPNVTPITAAVKTATSVEDIDAEITPLASFVTEAPSYLTKRVQPRGVGMWYGKTGSGKTFKAIGYGMSVAADNRGWGNWHTENGAVIYICLEDEVQARQNMLTYAEQQLGGVIPKRFIFRTQKPDLFTQIGINSFINYVKRVEEVTGSPVALIIIDTWSKLYGGNIDDNDKQQVRKAIENAYQVYNATGATMLYLGHTGKHEDKGHSGSETLPSDVDFMVQIFRVGGGIKEHYQKLKGDSNDFYIGWELREVFKPAPIRAQIEAAAQKHKDQPLPNANQNFTGRDADSIKTLVIIDKPYNCDKDARSYNGGETIPTGADSEIKLTAVARMLVDCGRHTSITEGELKALYKEKIGDNNFKRAVERATKSEQLIEKKGAYTLSLECQALALNAVMADQNSLYN